MAKYDDIIKNKYNLSVSTYIKKEDTRKVIDIEDLNRRLDECVSRNNQLRTDISQIIKKIA